MAPTSSQGSNNDVETRFNHLLNPIRDLTKNWEIDIATYLEQYLAELEGLTIAFNDGTSTLNFAEAALLIQGSTGVYSRKVEYLYNLVYQMLELLSNKKRQTSSDDQIKDKESCSSSRSLDEQFLSLDDIKEQKNLDLVEEAANHSRRKSLLKLLPVTPISLIPLEEGEKGDFMLFSRKGDILGYKRDFRINICNLDESGSLLLQSLRFQEEPKLLSLPSKDQILQQKNGQKDFETDDDYYCDEGGDPYDSVGSPEVNVPPQSPICSIPQKEQSFVKISPRTSPRTRKDVKDPLEQAKNQWAILDPHQEMKALQRPLRRTKRIRLPKKLQPENNKRKRQGDSDQAENSDASLQPLAESCSDIFDTVTSKQNDAVETPYSTALNIAFSEEIKQQKEYLKNSSEQGKNDNPHHDMEHHEDEPSDDDDFGPSSPLQNEEIPELNHHVPERFAGSPNTDEVTAVDRDELPVISSYEELVKKHVENYLANVAQYCKTTEISKHVSEWEDRIKPILEEEEKHEPYDIHVYGTRILNHFGSNGRKQTLSFAQICEGKDKWEICRYFLATLQLGNNYNVEITTNSILEEGMDTMELTLLSRKRHQEDLQNFRASSIVNQ